MMKNYILVFFLFIGIQSVHSQQIREFSTDTSEFVTQFSKFMGSIGEENQPVTKRFLSLWRHDSISFVQKQEIIEASNHMLRRRAHPEPTFVNYLNLLIKQYNPRLADKGYTNWFQSYNYLVSTSEVSFNEIERAMTLVEALIEDSVLYNLAGIVWKVDNDDYRFEIENNRPVVSFRDVNLSCYAIKDTMKITGAAGSFNFINLLWKGNTGRVNWERAGFEPGQVYADLSAYRIEFNRSQYQADSVKFYFKRYFSSPIEGYLQDRNMSLSDPSSATYPKFYSYESAYIIPELFREIEFKGGLSMQGAKFVGTGSVDKPARLRISENDTLRMQILSPNIVIRESSMSSTSCQMKIFLESDSIYHPDLDFLYLREGDEIVLSKKDVYTSGVPYSNSYHNMNMNFEELSWKRGSKTINFQPSLGRTIGQATFESNRFFNYSFFAQLQGRDFAHPLVSLWNFSRQLNGWREFPLTAYSGNIGRPASQVRHQMMKLSRMGFIYYDDQKDRIKLKDKLFYFIEASMGKTDFDVILFQSNVRSPEKNASLDLSNNDLTIKGIPNIFLSDSQNVVIVPSANQIVMKRNKDFQFDGFIKAGLITMYGSNFFFDYENFKVNLQDIDSLRVQVMSEDKNTGQREMMNIENLIQDLTGEVLIDKPDNKSGLEDNPDFPVFRSKEKSYVYFDDPSIQSGVYGKGEIYFEIDPFELDSLDNFTRQGMGLTGVFHSEGMLPPLEQKLTLRDDNSLGFVYETPEIGLPVYNGKGTFYNKLEMSSNGLHGSGHLEYLASTTYSDDFVFHPDSLMVIAREFEVSKQVSGTEFPEVHSQNNDIKWYTGKDEFYANMADIPYTMFADTVLLRGDLLLEPAGLKGDGTMDLVSSSVISNGFKYGAESILADSSEFRLNSSLSDKLAISALNVRANIDFESKTGKFYANEDYSQVEFPEILYSSNLDFFEWDMIDETVKMGLNKEIALGGAEDGLSGPRYYSLLSSQDSLNFVSPLAIYDYKDRKLTATEVQYIQVADSRIFPGDGHLEVSRNAQMKQLIDATIVTNFTSKYYTLFNASVTINGRNDYTASADYDYIDMTGAAQVIHFSQISVDSSGQTIGKGEIHPSDDFSLSPYFEFMGETFLTSSDPFLRFRGGARLRQECNMGRHWLKFEAKIDPNDVMIPVEETPLQYDLAPTYAGTMITRDSTHIYSTFFSPRKDYFDRFIISASGFLRFESNTERYEVASRDKLRDDTEPGNYLALDRSACIVHGQGEFNLQTNYDQIKLKTFGETVHNIPQNSFTTRSMMTLDFLFSPEALEIFANDIDSLNTLQPMNLTDSFYKQTLRELIGRDALDRLDADLGLYGEYRNIPEEMDKTLILSGVGLEWNQYTRSYRYEGEVGIVKVGDRMVNRKINAIISLTKKPSGDMFDIYLMLDDNNWYYFGYGPGSLQVVSSNRKFNNVIFELKARDRKLKTRPGETGYIYSLAPERRLQLFLRRFNSETQQQFDNQ